MLWSFAPHRSAGARILTATSLTGEPHGPVAGWKRVRPRRISGVPLALPAGHTLGLAVDRRGIGIGAVFAGVVLAIGVVSFPLLLDRHVGVHAAMRTSVRAVAANPGPMAGRGLIVTTALALGSIPLLLGLALVLPVLGHATWHLYRRVVADQRPLRRPGRPPVACGCAR